MASITKTASGYRAQIKTRANRDSGSALANTPLRSSGTFRTRREAEAWAAQEETRLRKLVTETPQERVTFGELLGKYAEEVSVHKRGRRWEEIRIEALKRDPLLDASRKIGDISSEMIGAWRNARLAQVKPATVIRELGLLSAVFEFARRELKWIKENPAKDVRRPASPDHRRVLISRSQVRGMLSAMKYSKRQCDSVTQAVAVAFLLALRTGMRAGEICGLTWDRVFDGYCKTSGKTSAATRDVPLTSKARRTIELMRGFDPVFVFGIKTASLDALFRKYRSRAGLSGFTFHDSRHTAATWIARKLHILDLCLMFGWSNTKHALIYYNAPASDIARQL